jgi:hypothetical protein
MASARKSYMRGRYWLVALALFSGFAGIGSPASAVVVDWNTVTWTPGTLTNSYDVDPGSAGNDVTVTVSGDTGQLQPGLVSPNPQTPAITQAFQGGLGTVPKTLELALDLSNNTQAVTVTVSFSSNYTLGVNNVSFSLFDIDHGAGGGSNYQDVIKSITAMSILNTTVSPTITGVGPNASLSGTGNNQVLTGMVSTVDLGTGSGDANATISFSSAIGIKSFTFMYGSSGAYADPTYQHVGIYNIDYSVIPETNPTWFSLISCGLLVCWNIRQALTVSRAKRGRGFLKRGVLRGTPRFGSATSG